MLDSTPAEATFALVLMLAFCTLSFAAFAIAVVGYVMLIHWFCYNPFRITHILLLTLGMGLTLASARWGGVPAAGIAVVCFGCVSYIVIHHFHVQQRKELLASLEAANSKQIWSTGDAEPDHLSA